MISKDTMAIAELNRDSRISIEKPELFNSDVGSELAANITIGDIGRRLWYRASGIELSDNADAFLAASLYLAMALGLKLEVEGNLSPMLVRATGTIQQIADKWYPNFTIISLTNTPIIKERIIGREVGCFFSGGVDSFYTLMKHSDHISRIVFVHGFDIPLANLKLRERVSNELKEIANQTGKELIEVETNLREISDQYIDWIHYFGSGLASVALLLSTVFKRIYIPSSETYAHLEPCGSHPLLDPLWSTEHLEIVHDGGEATRVDKLREIARYEIVLKTLRVCWKNNDNSYNCGVCEKCLRTMISLHAIGALDNCATFKTQLDPQLVSQIIIPNDLVLCHLEDNIKALKASTCKDSAILEALEKCISHYKRENQLKILPHLLLAIGSTDKRSDRDLLLHHEFLTGMWECNKKWVLKTILKEGIKDIDKQLLKGLLLKAYRKFKYSPTSGPGNKV